MAFTPASPVTGAAITGLTTPTYTLATDTAPSALSKQYSVSGGGGTQPGVTYHSISSPFTATFFRPANYKQLGTPRPGTGVIAQFPVNRHELLIRKGIAVAANQPLQLASIRTILTLPAGSDVYDQVNWKAALSLAIGLLWANGSSLCDTTFTGSLN